MGALAVEKLNISPKFDKTKSIDESIACCSMMIDTISDEHDQAAMRLVVKCLYNSMAITINKLIEQNTSPVQPVTKQNADDRNGL